MHGKGNGCQGDGATPTPVCRRESPSDDASRISRHILNIATDLSNLRPHFLFGSSPCTSITPLILRGWDVPVDSWWVKSSSFAQAQQLVEEGK